MSSKLISSNSEFIRELGEVLNRHNVDAQTNTPDFLLAEYLATALDNYQELHDATRKWHGVRYPMEHRQMHVQEPLDIEDIDAAPLTRESHAAARVAQTRREIRAAEVARDTARGKLNHVAIPRLPETCQIPDCGCTGRAHP